MADSRAQFGTRIGFILSGIGSAVGLGNIWRFPQLTSENGGAAFVFVYIPLLVMVGVPLLWAELAIGQRAQSSTIKAMGKLGGKAWRSLGMLLVAATLLFMSYYTVLAGLGLKYALFSVTDRVFADPATFLAQSTQGPGALGFHAFFTALTALVVSFGVAKGLERANLIMMPSLAAIVLALAIYAVLQPGASAGVSFYLDPDLSAIDLGTVQQALGQVFFSVGIGFGIMLTYASYMPRDRSMLGSASTIAFADLGVALVAGFMIFPLVFSQGLEGQVVSDSATQTTALYLTMPSAFANIGGVLGKVLLLIFFVMLTFAALSSSIAALEVLVSFLEDTWGITRWKSATLGALVSYGLGIAAALSVATAGKMDLFLSNILLFLSGIGICLLYTFALKDRVAVLLGGTEDPSPRMQAIARAFATLIAYVLPVLLLVIFVLGLPDAIERLLA